MDHCGDAAVFLSHFGACINFFLFLYLSSIVVVVLEYCTLCGDEKPSKIQSTYNFLTTALSLSFTLTLSFIYTQIATEHLFEHFDHKFRNKKGFRDVLTKIKDELMLMGFISVSFGSGIFSKKKSTLPISHF